MQTKNIKYVLQNANKQYTVNITFKMQIYYKKYNPL